MTSQKKRQSLIIGALTGTAGIFISRALGLLYASPFQAMAGNDVIFYSIAYKMYDFLLMVSLSGIPFAVATLVAKYVARDDYETVLMIRKVSSYILTTFGVILCLVVMLGSGSIVQMLAPGRDADYLFKYQVTLILISFALAAVPILSIFRGFYQGLKEMKHYAFSQVLEQIVRVTFLLGMGALSVYVFNKESIWAVYFAVVSTSVSALSVIIYFKTVDRSQLPELKQMAKEQKTDGLSRKEVFREIIHIAIPFFIISMIGNCSGMIDLWIVNPNLQVFGYSPEMADVVFSIMDYNAYKLVSIPQILGIGLSVALIPYVSSALSVKDYEGIHSNIKKVYTFCCYLVYPVLLLMILFAPEIYYVMYGAENVILGASILRWYLGLCFLWIIMTLSTNMLMVLEMKRVNLIWNVFTLVILIITMGPVTANFSYRGVYATYFILYVIYISVAWYLMYRKFNVKFTPILGTIAKTIFSLVAVFAVYFLFSQFGIDAITHGRIFALFWVGFICICAMLAYFVLTYFMKLPQDIFDFNISKLNFRKWKK